MADSFWDERVQKQEGVEQKNSKALDIADRISSYWYIPLLFLIGVAFSSTLAFFAMLALMIALAVLVSFYTKFTRYDLGIELISLFSITTAYAVHPFAGALVAAASILLTDYIHKRQRKFRNARVIVYAGLCLLVPFFAPATVAVTGIMLVLLRKAIFMIMTFFHDAAHVTESLPSVLINIALNTWLFLKLGEWLAGVLA
ncbi:hypothetical protein KY363_02085 [Candidatus Woesearchaeota archaeon]|nr:hypothetical protein [Candidatus Woesearchaeota archaeon]